MFPAGLPRMKATYIFIGLLITFCIFFVTPVPGKQQLYDSTGRVISQVSDKVSDIKNGPPTTPQEPLPKHTAVSVADDDETSDPATFTSIPAHSSPTPSSAHHTAPVATHDAEKPKYAFATYLSANENEGHYFVATRLLAYQLLHAPETRSNKSVPFIVLVSPDVKHEKRARLTKDGATVVEADYITEDWIVTENANWKDVMTKLRLWEMTDYERICFLDGDTVLTRPLDGIFDDPAVRVYDTKDNEAEAKSDEGKQPKTYSFAGQPEMMHNHTYPPSEEHHDYPNINYLNAGFFVLQPSIEMFEYYRRIMQIENRFKPEFPEQNLLNYAHRPDGNMPWKMLNNTWNIHYPTMNDLQGGVASLHEKWWAPEVKELKPYLEAWRWRMQGYYEAMDRLAVQHAEEEERWA